MDDHCLETCERPGPDPAAPAATTKQYDKMVKEGLGELDKSGIAELTFKGRHLHK